ncbi:MAG: methyltransferase domain-containing protein [Bacteroidetes bacterium]|nr:methyltransferase domain-containing protein [Bacteroidota bacterium]
MADQSTFTEEFWTERYKKEETGWNIGYASTPIVSYIDQLTDKDIRILIPGAGNAYEAEYLYEKGFRNVFVLDISEMPLKNLAERFPDFPKEHLIHTNFFEHDDHYDLILEQTFFCALHPSQRQAYADKMHRLLHTSGKLAGLWFGFPLKEDQEMPPFGGSVDEYMTYFEHFSDCSFEPCHNSITPRAGKELFGLLLK